jgi:hypothetical protein
MLSAPTWIVQAILTAGHAVRAVFPDEMYMYQTSYMTTGIRSVALDIRASRKVFIPWEIEPTHGIFGGQ